MTVIGILNQDMPFLLDSTLGELQAFGLGLRLVAHPIVSVTRDRTRPPHRISRHRAGTGGGDPREPHSGPCRPNRRRRAAAAPGRAARVALRRNTARRRRLAGDARAGEDSDRRVPGKPAADSGGGSRRSHRLPRMAGRRRLHLSRRPRLRLCRRRAARSAAPGGNARARHPRAIPRFASFAAVRRASP